MATRAKRVAVLGAGPSGLAAAMALAESGCEVHVYQMGWRAGGKCATGRDPGHFRTRQNGSHYLFGCYHNSFALIRRAHQRLRDFGAADSQLFGSFFGDFVARNLLVGAESYERLKTSPSADRGYWYRYLPQNMACPGEGGKFATPFDYAFMLLQLGLGTAIDLYAALVSDENDEERFDGCRLFLKWLPVSPFETSLYSRALRALLHPVRFVFNLQARGLALLFKGSLLLWAFTVPIPLTRWVLARGKEASVAAIAALRAAARGARKTALRQEKNLSNGLQRLAILAEIALSVSIGFLEDELWRPGKLEQLDSVDLRAWLQKHGASDFARNSSLVRTWYDATISYEDGVEGRASCSAGVALQAILRSLLTYKGAFAFQMRAEVGDSFVAPLVRALETMDNVKLHFYHRVRKLEVSSRSRGVERVLLDQQIETLPREVEFCTVEYAVKGRRLARKGWPSSAPSPCALVDGFPLDSYYSKSKHAECELLRGRDFDEVVCALPLGVVQDVLWETEQGCPVADLEGPWRDMFRQIRLTESQAIRMWFKVPLQGLGWRHEPPILSGGDWPHSTWEDNSQAVEIQNFPSNQQPLTIATVFGPLATGHSDVRDPRHPAMQEKVARENASRFLGRSLLKLWPALKNSHDGQIDWSKFIDLDDGVGERRFGFQLVSANVGPNESYVLAWPGTLKYRARPDESGYRHLFLAGDWTRNGIEAGTVEGAVMSGLKAARAVTGKPIAIVGAYDFDNGSLFG